MKILAIGHTLLVPLTSANLLQQTTQTLQTPADGNASRVPAEHRQPKGPVGKVITLLTEMRKTVAKEQKEDADLQEKTECWCKTNEAEKTDAIEAAERKLESLEAEIEELAATSGTLKTEIAGLKKEIAEKKQSLKKAEKIRSEENEAYERESQYQSETITALKQAVKVLGKHHNAGEEPEQNETEEEALLQVKKRMTDLLQSSTFQKQATRVSARTRTTSINTKFGQRMQTDLFDVLGSLVSPNNADIVSAPEKLLDEVFSTKDTSLLQSPALGAKSYNSRSGQIFGILSQMLEQFERDLKDGREAEEAARASFQKLTINLRRELKAAEDSKKDKTASLASAKQRSAQAKDEKKETEEALGADSAFLQEMKQRCEEGADAHAERTKTRADELLAISEALSYLTSGEARDLFSKTFSFAQTLATSSSLRIKAENIISHAISQVAQPSVSTSLLELTAHIKLDSFEKVKKAMDQMIAQLKSQQEDEVQHREFCRVEFDKNADESREQNIRKQDLEAHIDDLTSSLENASAEIDRLEGEVSTEQTELKRAGEQRLEENNTFQQVVADQRATQLVLKKTLERLNKFYQDPTFTTTAAHTTTPFPVLAQEPGQASSPAPPAAAEYEKNGASTGVLSVIQLVIADAKSLETETIKNEQEAQSAYSAFVTDTNNSVRAKLSEVAKLTKQKAIDEETKVTASENLSATLAQLEALDGEKIALHKACDFVVKNFDTRQEARQQEIDSIHQAKAVLSGADFSF